MYAELHNVSFTILKSYFIFQIYVTPILSGIDIVLAFGTESWVRFGFYFKNESWNESTSPIRQRGSEVEILGNFTIHQIFRLSEVSFVRDFLCPELEILAKDHPYCQSPSKSNKCFRTCRTNNPENRLVLSQCKPNSHMKKHQICSKGWKFSLYEWPPRSRNEFVNRIYRGRWLSPRHFGAL